MSQLIRVSLTLILSLLAALPSFAAPPQTLNYQGYLTSATGTPVNTTVVMTFKLYNAPTGGAPLYTESQFMVPVTNGSFNAVIGAVTPIPLPFDVPYWLTVAVNSDAEMSPRQLLASSAYAFRAASLDAAATISGAQVSGPVASAANVPTATTATTAASFSGPLGGDITGQQGSTTISAIRGSAVSAAVPADGQVLIFRGGQWQPAADLANLLASVANLNSPRAYVANINSNNVTVIDTASNTVVGAPIAVGSQPRGIAVNPSGSRAYVVNSSSNTVTVIDTATNTVVGVPITVGMSPPAIAVNPSGSRTYVANITHKSVI